MDEIERKRERKFWPQRLTLPTGGRGWSSRRPSASGAWFVRNFFDFVETSQDPDDLAASAKFQLESAGVC